MIKCSISKLYDSAKTGKEYTFSIMFKFCSLFPINPESIRCSIISEDGIHGDFRLVEYFKRGAFNLCLSSEYMRSLFTRIPNKVLLQCHYKFVFNSEYKITEYEFIPELSDTFDFALNTLRGETGLRGVSNRNSISGISGSTGLAGIAALRGETGLRGTTYMGSTGIAALETELGVSGILMSTSVDVPANKLPIWDHNESKNLNINFDEPEKSSEKEISKFDLIEFS